MQLKRYGEAAAQWEWAVKFDPKYGLGWLGLISAKIQLRDSAGGPRRGRPSDWLLPVRNERT